MRVKRSKQAGVRAEVLRKMRGLEHRCEVLEREVCALGLADQVRQVVRRLSALEERADK